MGGASLPTHKYPSSSQLPASVWNGRGNTSVSCRPCKGTSAPVGFPTAGSSRPGRNPRRLAAWGARRTTVGLREGRPCPFDRNLRALCRACLHIVDLGTVTETGEDHTGSLNLIDAAIVSHAEPI